MQSGFLMQPHTIVSARLTADGTIEIVRKYPSNMAYGNGQPHPDKVVKEIYAAGPDGRIVLNATVEGVHTPAHYVPEKIDFR